MTSTSSVPGSDVSARFTTSELGESLIGAGLTPTIIRFAGHLPYFKVGTALMLPQALSPGGVVATALTYALLCLIASRWLGARSPLLATLALVAAMMVVGPAIAVLLPDGYLQTGEITAEVRRIPELIIPYFGLLLPVCGGFLAVQWFTRPSLQRTR